MTIIMIWVLLVGGQPLAWYSSEYSCLHQAPPRGVCVQIPQGGEMLPTSGAR